MNNLIETSYDTYLIKFQNSSNGNVICKYTDLADALNKLNNGYILADIFRFNELKQTLIHKIRQSHFQIRFCFHCAFYGENCTFVSCPTSSGNPVVYIPKKH